METLKTEQINKYPEFRRINELKTRLEEMKTEKVILNTTAIEEEILGIERHIQNLRNTKDRIEALQTIRSHIDYVSNELA